MNDRRGGPAKMLYDLSPEPAVGTVSSSNGLFSCAWGCEDAELGWVAPVGELDLATVPMFQVALTAAFSAATSIVLDLRPTTFLDSAGARCIASADDLARRSERRFVLVRGPGHVQRVLAWADPAGALEVIELAGPRHPATWRPRAA